MFDETTLAPDDAVVVKETSKNEPTVDEAKKFTTEVLGLPASAINWNKLSVKVERSNRPGWADSFRFSTNEGTKLSIECTFSRGEKEVGFSNIVVNEYQPIPDTETVLQKTFRTNRYGVVDLAVSKAHGKDLIVGGKVLSIPSDRPYVYADGIKVPPNLYTMSSKEKEVLLVHGIHGILISNGLMDKPKGFDAQGFPAVLTLADSSTTTI